MEGRAVADRREDRRSTVSDGRTSPATVELSGALAASLRTSSRVVPVDLPLTEEQSRVLSVPDRQGNTPLLAAAESGDRDSLEFILRHGVDVDFCNRNTGRSAIDVVWENESYDCMLLLLEADSNFPKDFSPRHIDEIEPEPVELKLFVQQREDLHRWIKEGNAQEVRSYISQHRFSRFLNTEGVPAVLTAAKCGDVDVLAALLDIPVPVVPEKLLLTENMRNMLKLQDSNGNTPLLLAAKAGNEEIVDFLIKCGTEINFTNKVDKKAVDLAWECGNYKMVLLLLKEDSHFPKSFTVDDLSENDDIAEQLVSFANSRNELHNHIKNGNHKAVESFINNHGQSSKYYFNSKGASALLTAVTHSQYLIYPFLVSRGIHFKDQQESECLANLNHEGKTDLNNYMLQYFSGAENSHILYLVSKSKSMRPLENFENEVKGFYCELNRIPEISVALQVLQYADNIEIAFDFDREDVSHLDPRHTTTTKGTTEFKSRRLYVGFKRETPLQESERLGTLAHELAHLTMQIIYQNDCNPYGKYDLDEQRRFAELVCNVKKHCDRSPGVDDIIKRVFIDYTNPDDWPAELIVRIPHVLAKYGTDEGMDIIQKHTPLLYCFYKNHVMHNCTEFTRSSFLIKPRNMIMLLNQHLGVVNEFQRANIWFTRSYDPQSFLQSENHNVLLLGTSSTLLSSLCVYQTLQKLLQISFENSSLMLRISPSEDIQNDIIHTFSSQACNLMIVECPNGIEPQLSKILAELYHVFRSNRRKKVIFIIKSNQLSHLKLACDRSKITPRLVEDYDQEFTLKDFREESQKILLERTVIFQGSTIAVSDLFGDKYKTLVDSETLTKLVKKEKIEIGNILPELGDIGNYYVTRNLTIREEISVKIFDDNEINDLFFVTGQNDSLRSSLKIHKFVPNSDDLEDEQFSKFCAQNSEMNIHWLKWKEERLYWILTKGSFSGLTKYRFHRFQTYSVNESLFQDVRQKAIIISSTAGMGKSTIITDIAQKMKNNSPSMWIVRIDLNNFNDELSKLNVRNNLQLDENTAAEFLCHKMLKLNNVFERNLFTEYIKTEGAVTLFFDGFDEISPVYTDVVTALLKALKRCPIKRLFVTTRPSMTTLLEGELSTFSHNLVLFSEENINQFLVRFWRHKFNLVRESEGKLLEDYATAVLKKLSVSLNDGGRAFTGVPLQMRMVAEIFPENHNFDEINLPEVIDLPKLYELFIDKKYYIYKKDKVKPITVIAEDVVEQFRPISIKKHQKLAMFSLFPKEFICFVSDDESEDLESYILRINKGQERTGFINKVQVIEDTAKLLFIHRSFSEYFATDFILSRLRKKKQIILEILELLLTKILTMPSYELIRIFFNAKLTRQPLEGVVSEKCGEIINNIWLSAPENICTVKNETILHLAVKERNFEIVSFILSSLNRRQVLRKFINYEDDEGLSAIQEAVQIENVQVLQWLVERGANVNAVDNDGKSVLFYALKYQQLKFSDYLTEHGADVKLVDIHSLYRCLDDKPQRLEVLKMLVDKGANITMEDNYGETLLHCAAERGDYEFIKWLIENGKVCVNYEDSEGTKLIHLNASSGQWELVKWLIQHESCDVNVKDRIGNSVLNYAAFKGCFDVVQWLAKPKADGGGGADINAKGELNSSVLHDAAISGNIDLVEWLATPVIQGGGGLDINAKDDDGRTPLHEAAFYGLLDLVEWMVKAQKDGGGGADVNIKDKNGETALYSAAYFGQLELVQLLLNKTHDVQIPNKDGKMVLHVAAAFGEVNLVAKLLDDGISSVDTKDAFGRSALHYAAEHNNHEVVSLLLDYGASEDCRDNEGGLAIHYAASTGKHDIEKWLEDRYVDINVAISLDCDGAIKKLNFTLYPHKKHMITFLRRKKFKIENDNNDNINLTIDALATLKVLIHRGSDVNEADYTGKTALYNAVFLTHRGVESWDVVRWLIKPATNCGGGADVSAVDMCGRTVLHEVAKYGEVNTLKNLLELLQDDARIVNNRDKDGRTPLHEIARNSSFSGVDVIKLLVENGADINAPDNNGRTALHEVSKSGFTDAVRVLFNPDMDTERRGNVCAEDNCGRTPLHEACAAGNLQVAKLLVLNNADVNSRDKDGRTCLHYAALSNKFKVVKWLLEKCDINYKDNFGKTAFNLAQENESEEVVKTMTEHFVAE
ncbi:uncharacterized protein LOC134542151 [Bacillus rossius redtenbacheri]|uniref:uncharacterized protein LOC134542151 n=1 Tax=Bacillus rossius redtenbacheri TaxID=93214 RepID=UPI002FDE82CC